METLSDAPLVRDTTGPHVVRAACPHDGPGACAMLVTVEQGRVIRTRCDPDHPTTHGALSAPLSRHADRAVRSW
jgi:anaerobic selenocysteine-containing dehydrogenase